MSSRSRTTILPLFRRLRRPGLRRVERRARLALPADRGARFGSATPTTTARQLVRASPLAGETCVSRRQRRSTTWSPLLAGEPRRRRPARRAGGGAAASTSAIWPRGESTRRFLDAVDDLIARRDELLEEKEAVPGVELGAVASSEPELPADEPSCRSSILAAGLGVRLGRPLPKPLTPLRDGRSILQQQHEALASRLSRQPDPHRRRLQARADHGGVSGLALRLQPGLLGDQHVQVAASRSAARRRHGVSG